jgi:UDP-glucose 4-epimerase
MNCLVTGGAGFIGSHLTESLINEGHQVTVIDNLVTGRLENLDNVFQNQNFVFINYDIREIKPNDAFLKDIDWVFHLAGLADVVPSIENPDDYFNTNVGGTFNILRCSKANKVSRFIYAASSSCYGIPDNYPTDESSPIQPQYPYALTKYMGEELVLHWAKIYGLPSISLRLFNVYGPRSRTTGAYGAVFGVFLAQKLNQRPYTVVGDGTQTRDFTYVTDVVRAFHSAAESDLNCLALNVGSGDHQSINSLIKLLGGEVIYIPKRPGEPDCTFANIEKINNLLKWYPKVSFQEGVSSMLANIQNWKDAPIWDPKSIEKATAIWFKYLNKDNKF